MEPIDFESYILKNKMLIQNDPQRELLLYPPDDVSVSRPYMTHKIILKIFLFIASSNIGI